MYENSFLMEFCAKSIPWVEYLAKRVERKFTNECTSTVCALKNAKKSYIDYQGNHKMCSNKLAS